MRHLNLAVEFFDLAGAFAALAAFCASLVFAMGGALVLP